MRITDWELLPQTQKRLILERPELYPDHPEHVECIETHLSWILLTNRVAYKVRKPVSYGKLNYTTVQSRFLDGLEEVRLNRRLAGDLYYGLISLTYSAEEGFKVGGSGKVLEWMIKMRRLPAEQMLDFKIKNNTLTEPDVRAFVDRLLFFYKYQDGALTDGESYIARLKKEIDLNHTYLSNPAYGLSPALLSRLRRIQLGFVSKSGEQLSERARKGYVIDGHGDLRPEHICIEADRQVTIFDCLQFDPELRTIDCIDELSFLSLECERIGAPQVNAMIFDRYSEVTGSPGIEPICSFYKTYRACMWARLAVERTGELEKDLWDKWLRRANEYLGLADKYSQEFSLLSNQQQIYNRFISVDASDGPGK